MKGMVIAMSAPEDIELKARNDDECAPRLLLHCCCAPCASYALEYLSHQYRITILFFNPNIQPREEYIKRAEELGKLLTLVTYPNPVDKIVAEYDPTAFKSAAEPFLEEPEGGNRCRECFKLRLGETAALAKAGGYDLFATTLTVSPHKSAPVINEVGAELAESFGVEYLRSDFKKKDGYRRSVELSKQYGLYRQLYCGCSSSMVL